LANVRTLGTVILNKFITNKFVSIFASPKSVCKLPCER